MKRILPKTLTALTLAMVSAPAVWSQTAPPALGDAANAELDSINAGLDRYESMARRSIMGGGSKPVSFAGEAIGRIIGSTYGDYPQWMQADATTMKNSFATLRVAMVAAPNRNLRLWSKIAFNHALMGDQEPSRTNGSGSGEVPLPAGYYRSPTTGEAGGKAGSLMYEDMCAGLVAKMGPTTWSVKAGGVLWNELSPLTVWKIQPRIFAWDYLPFELEQSTAQFYDYGTVKGEKSGRAAWNKKPFQGLQLESVELPLGMYFNGFYGLYEGYGKNQTWLAPNDKNTELQYTEGSGVAARTYATKGIGISDEYRMAGFLRVAKNDVPGGLAIGGNWFGYMIDENYPKQWAWAPSKDVGITKVSIIDSRPQVKFYKKDSTGTTVANKTYTYGLKSSEGSGFKFINNYYVQPQVGSIDIRRTVPGGLNFHVDIAMSKADSIFYKVSGARYASLNAALGYDTSGAKAKDTTIAKAQAATVDTLFAYREGMREKAATVRQYEEIGRTNTGWVPGVFADVSYPASVLDQPIDLELRSVYLPKKFQSPASVANIVDGIFPYESNMTGASKFAGSDNGTAYASNLAGSNLIVKLPIPRGHAKVSWGLHGQLEDGRDVVYFPWRQNGAAYNATLGSDFTQYDQGLLNDYLRAGSTFDLRQAKRLADEFWVGKGNANAPTVGDAGGERSTFMATYEGFVPYKLTKSYINLVTAADSAQWALDTAPIAKNSRTGALPVSQKFTQNLSFDVAYEISRLWEGKKSLFLSGYAAFNSVTKDNRVGIPAFSADDDNVLLMGRNLRFEPVFQVTPKFYIVGLVGNEIWKSNYGVAYIDTATGKAPVNATVQASSDKENSLVKNPQFLVRAPIDYSDMIYGLGFDWDMASRVGLHVRCQYFTHEDKGISTDVSKAKGVNDYDAWLTTAEVKMWF